LEALGLLVELLAACDEPRRRLRRLADRARRLRPLVLPAARERLDERDDREPLLVGKLMPRGHRRPAHAASHRTVEIAVGRQRARRCRAELEDPEGEIARARRKERRGRPVAVAVLAVAAAASGVIDLAAER